jgi:hypothetical protein
MIVHILKMSIFNQGTGTGNKEYKRLDKSEFSRQSNSANYDLRGQQIVQATRQTRVFEAKQLSKL